MQFRQFSQLGKSIWICVTSAIYDQWVTRKTQGSFLLINGSAFSVSTFLTIWFGFLRFSIISWNCAFLIQYSKVLAGSRFTSSNSPKGDFIFFIKHFPGGSHALSIQIKSRIFPRRPSGCGMSLTPYLDQIKLLLSGKILQFDFSNNQHRKKPAISIYYVNIWWKNILSILIKTNNERQKIILMLLYAFNINS